MNLTRRELLTLFLGAPFAMSACGSGESRPVPVGEIVGQASNGQWIVQNLFYQLESQRPSGRWFMTITGYVAGPTSP